MKLITDVNLEIKLNSILREEAENFQDFLEDNNVDYSKLEEEDYFNEIVELYHEWLPENKKIILENRLNQLENELILDITGQFGAVLETEAEKNKWALIILALIPIFQTIYQINIRKIYEDTAQRILSMMKKQQEILESDENTDEFKEKTKVAVENSNNFHSVDAIGNFLSESCVSICREIRVYKFVWETMQDGKVRELPDMNHVERQGQIFDMYGKCLSKQLEDNRHIVPKEDPFCRCWFVLSNIEIRKGVINAKI